LLPPGKQFLALEETTIAEVLKPLDTSALIGNGILGLQPNTGGKSKASMSAGLTATSKASSTAVERQSTDRKAEGEYLTDRLSSEAASSSANRERPFFLYCRIMPSVPIEKEERPSIGRS
jgi:hypothetical protein